MLSQSRSRTWLRLLAVVGVLSLFLVACGGGDEPEETETTASPADDATSPDEGTETEGTEGEQASGEPIRVAVLTSTSGPLASYGEQYVDGFELGLEYATDGTMAVNGRPIEVTYQDDTGDPAQATSVATDLIGQGYTIIAGTVVSGVALQLAPLAEQNDILYVSGPAAADAITGINRNTFRSGRQSYQDVATAGQFLDDVEGKTVAVFAQDTAFGQANVGAVEAVLGAEGATVESILVPADTSDFTPFAARANESGADLLFVAWAGETASAMWQSLGQQGVLENMTVVTGLDQRASWETAFGEVAGDIDFLAHYFAEAPDTEVNQWIVDNHEGTPDLFTPDGFVAAQMIVQALTEGDPDDTMSMIEALEGWTFDAPKGSQTIRAEDHAMLQPMFQASLSGEGGEITAEPVNTVDAEAVAPPAGSFEDES
ncbi:MAG: substrate-binding domain-containing protein [Actinobacteria bacterium]|nr:substrate-binding domain-containing protein [Actinomycetota bacterium]